MYILTYINTAFSVCKGHVYVSALRAKSLELDDHVVCSSPGKDIFFLLSVFLSHLQFIVIVGFCF